MNRENKGNWGSSKRKRGKEGEGKMRGRENEGKGSEGRESKC